MSVLFSLRTNVQFEGFTVLEEVQRCVRVDIELVVCCECETSNFVESSNLMRFVSLRET